MFLIPNTTLYHSLYSLQPCNIFLINENDSGEILVKIGDFGLARAVQRNINHLRASSRANIFPDYSGMD